MLHGGFMNKKIAYSVLNCLCVACGDRENNFDNEHHQSISETYKLYYVTQGKGMVTIDGIGFFVSSGQSFLTFPFSNVCLKPDKNSPWSYKWVEFRGLEAAEIISQTDFSKKHPVVDNINVADFENYFDIPESRIASSYSQYRAIGKLIYLLSYYLEHFPRKKAENNDYTLMARNYIEKNYRNPEFNVQSVAQYIKIDRTYLYRLFIKETGMSVIDYINNCRISKAQTMLLDKNTSIKDVAYSVGFADQMYFSKVFKKINGMTPTEYRKQHQNY